VLASGLAVSLAVSALSAERRPFDAEHSTLTVLVFKSGLFSALADNHVISAPIASGSLSDEAPFSVDMAVRAADLKVVDPDLAANRRADVQMRMLGPDVLDAATYPDISFKSTAIDLAGKNRWTVTGRLTIRGQTRVVTFLATVDAGHYRGTVSIKQRDFGIDPISIAGGAVKVKDELKIQFDIVPSRAG
jgi:polyisoprenoid-binding protein YceI